MDEAVARLTALSSGRHYGSSPDSQCWAMVGRDLRDVTDWSIIPPAASLTYAWGAGGCVVEFGGGSLRMRLGDLMWIDAGFAHRGQNLPGSDFLTVFIPEEYVTAASLDVAKIGASARHAPPEVAAMLARLAVLLLDGALTRHVEAPLLDAMLDWVGTVFEPLDAVDGQAGHPTRVATMFRADRGGELRIVDVARTMGLSPSELSRRFKEHHRLTPKLYRKQLRLALATRALARGSSVLEAAHDAGFSDSAHLSRTFRAQYGIAPSQWSKRFRGAGTSDSVSDLPEGITSP